MNPKVDEFFSNAENWQAEMEKLRSIILECGLTEELKWKAPCYTYQDKNIVIIAGLKEYCAIGFFKGALLNDSNDILMKPGKNTQAARLIRFTSAREIGKLEPIIKAYIYEAIEIENAGLKVRFKKSAEFPIPEELRSKFNKNPAFKKAFDALTPGRQRGYLLYFSAPKQSKTRETRIEKSTPKILRGKGLNDYQ